MKTNLKPIKTREPIAERWRSILATICIAVSSVFLISCGGGSGGNSDTTVTPKFRDVTAAAGLQYLQHAEKLPASCNLLLAVEVPVNFTEFCQTDRMTGGAAVADVDGDGDLDLFVTRLDNTDILFLNKGDGSFENGSVAAGFTLNLKSNGAAFADIDNDGDQDLYVSVMGNVGEAINNRNYLFINNGTGVFTEDAIARGADITSASHHRSFSISFGDYDRDGWLDMHVTEWGPSNLSHSRLLRNKGIVTPGHFDDVTVAAGVAVEGVFGFGTTFTDLDQDGWPDLAIAGDFGTSRLFWNNGDGTFTNGTAAAGVGTDENGMGSTFGDFDGDGDLDWFVTAIFDSGPIPCIAGCPWAGSGNRLYRNDGSRSFLDVADAAGVRDGYWGWGAAFFDYDNDADLDLVMTNGIKFPGTLIDDKFNDDPMRMWRNNGTGSMTEVSASLGINDVESGKGLLVFDYDQDGDLDVFVVNNGGQPRLYQNSGGNSSGWLRVKTVGVTSNRDGIGARITVRQVLGGIGPGAAQVREVGTSTHFLGQSERTAHFGLRPGTGSVAEVKINWPSGKEQILTNVARNSTLTVTEN